ncbi:HD domain-containing protein [Geodermatophilus africanus]|uniref:HD domain-containing protein n=1 Tax=Geodermatophilus africanus TaxID=1137993 RepID=A0A1H3DAS2_9ACTN|nr:HD domain-containing protein [Geodermatophilus africanus]SDX63457.1 HD domain-containing protein [Geodermatophilus africanus]
MPDLQQRELRDAVTGHPLVEAAFGLAHDLLGGLSSRWRHTRGVAHRAATAAAAVPQTDRPVLVAAAWLHDIGYAQPLRRSGFHPLDGAWHLQEHSWPEPLAGLVAHHSAARFVAAVRGLAGPLRAFSAPRFARGPLADALTYADQTTGPDGQVMAVEDRLAEMLRRHGPDSPNARVHPQRAPAIRAAVLRIEQRLRARR